RLDLMEDGCCTGLQRRPYSRRDHAALQWIEGRGGMIGAWIFGAGGHSKVVIDTLRACGDWDLEGILDDDPKRWGRELFGIPVRGAISEESIARFGIRRAIIAVGSNETRAQIARRFANRVSWLRAAHPRAYVALETQIGEGTVVFAGVVVQPGA